MDDLEEHLMESRMEESSMCEQCEQLKAELEEFKARCAIQAIEIQELKERF